VVPLDSSVNWSYSFNLSEGINNISITSRDAVVNESAPITTTIILDSSAPGAPTLDAVVSPTNVSLQTLSGTKEINTSIWINSLEVVPINPTNTWTYDFNLSGGENNISITSRDAAGNESSAIAATIEYDPNIHVDAGNTSGIEDGTITYPFNTITEGIDAVVPGKSVIVAAGTFNEQLIINKEITLQGASQDNTFITGSGLTENLISLEADNITISGFTIDGDSSTSVGIYFDNYTFININTNVIQNNISYGIKYNNSSPTIENNNIKNNNYSGIDIAAGGAGIVRNNSLIFNQYGIRTCGDSSPEITGNDISNNSNTGIYCRESATPIISYNNISNNGYGILIDNILGNSVNPDIGGVEGGSAGKNNITGNYIHGVSNETTHSIMALNNWWGDAAGPKYPGNPNNATISSDWAYWSNIKGIILFNPYSTEP
jgi:parallel beta-helix repeat protein